MLAAALAPVLLIGGALMASPRYGGIALPTMMGMGSPALIAATQTSNFAAYANGSIAQLVGTWFAIVMTALMQAAGAHHAIRRTIRAGWADIAQRANLMRAPDVRGWINRMLDRIGLLAPRLAAIGQDGGRPLYDALRDLRTGVAIGELRQLRLDLPADQAEPLTEVLAGVGDYYRRLDPDAPPPPAPALLDNIDSAIAAIADNPQPAVRREGTLGLVSLRRNLFPEADSYRRAA
jgi:uncharacterized membrane protein YccC